MLSTEFVIKVTPRRSAGDSNVIIILESPFITMRIFRLWTRLLRSVIVMVAVAFRSRALVMSRSRSSTCLPVRPGAAVAMPARAGNRSHSFVM